MGDIRALGYLTIDTTDLDRWRTLAHDVLDLGECAGGDDDTLYLRLDERARRITLRRAEKDTSAWAPGSRRRHPGPHLPHHDLDRRRHPQPARARRREPVGQSLTRGRWSP
ncbi:hypothetical protein [Dietzia lutea]|uniref:hypothetical protein n=1 Tax=Dietzia lutea TaxID=546160 RepID=UPI0013300878|nr:hypothetical protein [Dietzia lutea]